MPHRPLSNDRKTPRMLVEVEKPTVKIITFEPLNMCVRTLVSAKKIQIYDNVQLEF